LPACKKKQELSEEKKPVLVEVIPVNQGEIARIIQFTGSIEADAQVQVFPKLSATINKMSVDLGDRVKKGEVIAVLDSEELRAQLSQTEAALAVLRANWAQMEKGARSEEIAQAEDLVKKATAGLREAESNYRRMKDLYDKGGISEKQFESSETANTVARADLNSARERLKMLKTGATQEDRDALKARIRQAEAALDLARIRFSYARITAPFDGIISERFFEPGDLANPARPLFTVVRMDSVKLVISFQGDLIRNITVGILGHVHVAAYSGEEFSGKIVQVSPTLNPETRMFTAEIRIDNESYRLRPGMFATATFEIDPHPEALLLPKETVLYRQGGESTMESGSAGASQHNYVFVIENETSRLREVSLGHESEGMVEIIKGVVLGDLVVERGMHQLKDGDRVKIVKRGGI
jgi:RND family efflux transporter MFP subunit